MQFEYLYKTQATGFIDIENIGHVCLSMTNDLYHEYIMIVKTESGWTRVLTFGPWIIDSDNLTIGCSCSISTFEFNAGKIAKMIDKLLNGNALITQVTEITEEEAKSRLKNLGDYI